MTSSRWLPSAFLPLLLLACSPDGTAPGEVRVAAQGKPESMEQRASYSIGYNLGRTLRDQGIEVDMGLIRQGISDGFEDAQALLTAEEMQAAINELQQAVQARISERRSREGAANLEAGESFLSENGQRDGVVTTASGLQYEVLTEGSGAKPSATSTVTVHYVGTLLDGTKFDSSVDRGQPAQFPLNRVIPGWTEGLQLMSVGSKYRLFVPAGLAYGEAGAGADIGPNSTLIFEVELIAIEGAP